MKNSMILFLLLLCGCTTFPNSSEEPEEVHAIEETVEIQEESENELAEKSDFVPVILTEPEKKELLKKYRGYWSGEELPVTDEERYNPFEQALIKIYTDEDAPFIPIKELGDEYDLPDFMDGFLATYYGIFYRANKVTQIDENKYVFEELEYIWSEEGDYIDKSGKEWRLISLTIYDPNVNDDSIILSVTYNQDSSISEYLASGMEFKRWDPYS